MAAGLAPPMGRILPLSVPNADGKLKPESPSGSSIRPDLELFFEARPSRSGHESEIQNHALEHRSGRSMQRKLTLTRGSNTRFRPGCGFLCVVYALHALGAGATVRIGFGIVFLL